MTGGLLQAAGGPALPGPARAARALDPELPDLLAVLHPARAVALWGPPGGLPVSEQEPVPTAVHSVRWNPGLSCQVVYQTRQGTGRRPAVSFAVLSLTADGASWQRLQDDPDLAMAGLLDDPALADRLRPLAARLDGWSAEPVRYRPGSRCVVRYDLHTADGVRRVYAKVLPRGSAELAATTRFLGRAGLAEASGGQSVSVPPVLAEWEDLGAVVCGEAPGRSLSDLLRDATLPVAARVRLAAALGGLLARVHAVPDLPAAVRTAEDELGAVAAGLAPAWSCDPVAAPMAAGLLTSLAASTPRPVLPVVSHGAFRAGQVRVGPTPSPIGGRAGTQLHLLDLDGVCWADPGLDLGNAEAYLAWQGVRNPELRPLSRRLAAALLEGYLAGGGQIDAGTLPWWRATAMVKIATRRYRGLAVPEWPAVPGLLRLARAALESPAVPVGRPGRRARDPRAGAIAELVDPRAMTSLLRPVLSGAAGIGARVRVLDVEVLASVGGRRAVVRCAVAGRRSGTVVPVVAKVYADAARAAVAFDNQQRLHRALAGTGAARAPEPLGLVPERAMLVYRAADGIAVLDVAPADRLPAVQAAGAALRALHGADVRLSRIFEPAAEAVAVRGWARVVGRHVPAVAAAAAALGERLGGELGSAPLLPGVPVHKDFHAGHVLLDGVGAWLLDLDEARAGDPALDVAHFLVHLEAAGWPAAGAAREAFWRGYGRLPGAHPERRLALFRAWAGLKLARQVVNGSAPEAAPAGDTMAVVLAGLLREAASCLDR